MGLPQLAALKSKYNGMYLRNVSSTHLEYSSKKLIQNNTIFALDAAAASRGRKLVNIRSTYNNKYWRRESQHSYRIVAAAEKPEEDQSKWECTLFQVADHDSNSGAYRIIHIQLGKEVSLEYGSRGLHVKTETGNAAAAGLHEIIDWESIVKLPEYVVFKGDNGKYVTKHDQNRVKYMRCASDDPGSTDAAHQTYQMPDGTVRLRSLGADRFWRRSPNWIWADASENDTGNVDTLFKVVKINKNIVGLRNLGNNMFCRRIPDLDWKFDCLNASDGSISQYSRLDVSEYVVSRKIYNIQFRVEDSRRYGEKITAMDSQIAENGTNAPNDMSLDFTMKKEWSSSWSSTTSWKMGVFMTMESEVPLIGSYGMTMEFEFSQSYEWGKAHVDSHETVSKYNVNVPPKTRIKVNFLATKATADVPYSYTQRDVLADGTVVIKDYDDGIYKVTNNYNFHYETSEEREIPQDTAEILQDTRRNVARTCIFI